MDSRRFVDCPAEMGDPSQAGCAWLKKAVLRQLNQSRRTRPSSRLLLSASRTTHRSLPSVYICGLQARIGQRFIWRVDSEFLALGGRLLSRQVVPGDPQKLSRKVVTRARTCCPSFEETMSMASSIKRKARRRLPSTMTTQQPQLQHLLSNHSSQCQQLPSRPPR